MDKKEEALGCLLGMHDELIQLMNDCNIPLTRENYLNLNYFGDIPEEIDEDDLPEIFRNAPAQE